MFISWSSLVQVPQSFGRLLMMVTDEGNKMRVFAVCDDFGCRVISCWLLVPSVLSSLKSKQPCTRSLCRNSCFHLLTIFIASHSAKKPIHIWIKYWPNKLDKISVTISKSAIGLIQFSPMLFCVYFST